MQSICIERNNLSDESVAKILRIAEENKKLSQEQQNFKKRMECLYSIKKYCKDSAIARLPKPILFKIAGNVCPNMKLDIIKDNEKAELLVSRKAPNLKY